LKYAEYTAYWRYNPASEQRWSHVILQCLCTCTGLTFVFHLYAVNIELESSLIYVNLDWMSNIIQPPTTDLSSPFLFVFWIEIESTFSPSDLGKHNKTE